VGEAPPRARGVPFHPCHAAAAGVAPGRGDAVAPPSGARGVLSGGLVGGGPVRAGVHVGRIGRLGTRPASHSGIVLQFGAWVEPFAGGCVRADLPVRRAAAVLLPRALHAVVGHGHRACHECAWPAHTRPRYRGGYGRVCTKKRGVDGNAPRVPEGASGCCAGHAAGGRTSGGISTAVDAGGGDRRRALSVAAAARVSRERASVRRWDI
jgi:hypothetical protein